MLRGSLLLDAMGFAALQETRIGRRDQEYEEVTPKYSSRQRPL